MYYVLWGTPPAARRETRAMRSRGGWMGGALLSVALAVGVLAGCGGVESDSSLGAELSAPVGRGQGEAPLIPVSPVSVTGSATVELAGEQPVAYGDRTPMPGTGNSTPRANQIDIPSLSREAGKKRVLLFNLSGHGLLDLSSYESYLSGKVQDV